METQSNPCGTSAEKRFAWADGMDMPTLVEVVDKALGSS